MRKYFSGSGILEIINFNTADDNNILMMEITCIKELSITAWFKISTGNYEKKIFLKLTCRVLFFQHFCDVIFYRKTNIPEITTPDSQLQVNFASNKHPILFFLFRTHPILHHQF